MEYIPGDRMFHVTDLIKALQKDKKKIGVYPISEKSWLDVGQWESYKETAEHLLDKLRSEEHTSELQSHSDLVCRLLLEQKNPPPPPHPPPR